MKTVVTFGEVLARLSTEQGHRLTNASNLQLNFGGAEANVAISLAQFGNKARLVTKLPDNLLGKGATNYLKSLDVDTDLIDFGGERLGSYYLETGGGNRSSKVIYDRKYSSFSALSSEELDFSTIFENAYLLHVTGITPALSDEMVEVVELLFSEAKQQNLQISFDFNYRSKLWTQKEAGKAFKRLLPYVDICSCAELDMIYLLGYPKLAEELDYEEKLDHYYTQLTTDYPNIKLCMSTRRESISSSHNTLKGFLYTNSKLYTSKTYNIDHIIDRVGGGDAFVAGILHGTNKNWDPHTTVSFATAASVLKHTIRGDANIVSEAEVKEMITSGHNISR